MVRHSIVIPVFNEESGLEELYAALMALFASHEDEWEAIFVNDGSVDGSAALLNLFHERDRRCRVLHFSRNFGQQSAILAGLQFASGNTVTIADADLQDPIDLIPSMLDKWRAGFEVVNAVRIARMGETLFKKWSAALFYKLMEWIAEGRVSSCRGDFRLIDRKVVNALLDAAEGDVYVRGLVGWLGFKQTEMQYTRIPRTHGKTHYSTLKMLDLAINAITSFSVRPLRIVCLVSLLFGIMSICWFIIFIVHGNNSYSMTPSWFPTSAILFIFSLQFLFMGIIAEYIARLVIRSSKRPQYIISTKVGFQESHE